MAAKRWDELSARQQVGVAVAGAIQLGLLSAALVDLWRRPGAQVRGSKRWWAAASFVNFVGPLAYFAFGRRRGQAS
ncbi:MAG TPA: PLDc N-terminal domain-containing protein [Actinomycetes bacterium]|nr:PLDc N-terminal domain-containing protein [Actinomycetes bacterium]